MSRSPSLFDVAKHCGVSHQTVSRVVNGNPNVSPATRAKVIAAIEALGYQQNLAARALATGRSRTIGVVSYDSTLYGPTAMLHSIQLAAREHGYRVVLNAVTEITNSAISAGIADLATSNVDGILVIAPRASTADEPLAIGAKVPVIFREIQDGEPFAVVDIDQRGAGRAVAELLVAAGHDEVAHISGPLDWITAKRRRDGWAEVATGPEVNGDWSARSGYEGARALLKSGEPFSAIFAANDAMAFGALRALTEAGVAVPGDVALVGFDDTAEAEFASPALSTVRQDFDAVGERLLESLLEAIEAGSAPSESVLIPGELVLRESVLSA